MWTSVSTTSVTTLYYDCREQGVMKAVVQRVLSASVRVEGEVVATMGKGLVALVGIHRWPHP